MSDSPVQAPGFYRTRVGDVLLTSLNDGYIPASFALMRNIEPADAERLMAEAHQPGARITVNAFLITRQGRNVLIDAGGGTKLGATAGAVVDNLREAGMMPDEIDDVVLTHLHRDHAGGLVDDAGRAVFPKASVHLAAPEAAFWFNQENQSRAPDSVKTTFAIAAAMRDAYSERVRTFKPGDEVCPALISELLPGHTPGHSGFHIRSGDDQLLIWGDIVHMPVLQTARPDITIAFDHDPEQAAATRSAVLERAASQRLRVAGMHMSFPGLGHVASDGSGYRIVPEVWMPLPD